MMTSFVARSLDRGALAFLAILAGLAVLVPALNLLVPETSALHLPSLSGSSAMSDLAKRLMCIAR